MSIGPVQSSAQPLQAMGRWLVVPSLLFLASCGGPRPVQEFNARQQVVVEGSKSGRAQVGDWRYYYDGGQLKAEGAWEDDLQTSP